ncbi:kinase-like domain-containing protein [Xylariaceae sp. FL0662B]|nr:kinase-like domain-containing protein [Xylariaceae sp. FL0662B]
MHFTFISLKAFFPYSLSVQSLILILSSANFEHLEKHAINSRRRHLTNLPPNISCSINLTHFATDNVYWTARIPHCTTDDDTRTSLLSEVATVNIIRKHTSIPVPQIFEFEMSTSQPFGYPYVLMEYLGGRTLDNGLAVSIPLRYQSKVAKQLANIFVELRNLTFSRPVEIIGMAQGENREIVPMHPNDPDWLTSCWVLKTALTQIIIEDRLSVCPEFATFPGLSEEENRPIVELKHLDIQFIKEMERDIQKTPPLDNQQMNMKQNLDLTPLATYMASPRGSFFAGKMVAKLIYSDTITREQLTKVYGTMPLF